MRGTSEIKPEDEFVCGYGRVSTGHQFMGIPDQLDQINLYSSQIGLSVQCVYTDQGITGATVDRPAWQAMWEEISKHPGSHLIVWDVGRLIRDYGPGAELVILCRRHSVVIHDCEQGPLTEDQLAERIQFFTVERKKIAANLRRGRRGAVNRGAYAYAELPGYRKGPGGVLKECPITGPIMREILRRASAGEKWAVLADYANKRGLKPRFSDQFTGPSLAQLCRNEVYTGRKPYNDPVFSWEERQASNERRTEALRARR